MCKYAGIMNFEIVWVTTPPYALDKVVHITGMLFWTGTVIEFLHDVAVNYDVCVIFLVCIT
jgi:hypothetical protein